MKNHLAATPQQITTKTSDMPPSTIYDDDLTGQAWRAISLRLASHTDLTWSHLD